MLWAIICASAAPTAEAHDLNTEAHHERVPSSAGDLPQSAQNCAKQASLGRPRGRWKDFESLAGLREKLR